MGAQSTAARTYFLKGLTGRSNATYGLGLKETVPGVAAIYFLKPGSDTVVTEHFSVTPKGVYFRRTVRHASGCCLSHSPPSGSVSPVQTCTDLLQPTLQHATHAFGGNSAA